MFMIMDEKPSKPFNSTEAKTLSSLIGSQVGKLMSNNMFTMRDIKLRSGYIWT